MSKLKIGIIADSSCDLSNEMLDKSGITLIPFKINLLDKTYIDDGSVDILELIHDMRSTSEVAKSACPSAGEFADAMRPFDICFAITLSSNLSGSYNAAHVAANMVMEEDPNKKVFVIDSKSATAGEVALALYVQDLVEASVDPETINTMANDFVSRMSTLLMLIDLDNLLKNGRISKVSKFASSTLQLRPIMKADENGEIALVKAIRSTKKAIQRLVDMVQEQTSVFEPKSKRLIITYCNCEDQANAIKEKLIAACPALREIIALPTRALSSMYANDGGIVIAFDN